MRSSAAKKITAFALAAMMLLGNVPPVMAQETGGETSESPVIAEASSSPSPSPEVTIEPSIEPSEEPAVSEEPSEEPSSSPEPSASAEPSEEPSEEPSSSPEASAEPSVSPSVSPSPTPEAEDEYISTEDASGNEGWLTVRGSSEENGISMFAMARSADVTNVTDQLGLSYNRLRWQDESGKWQEISASPVTDPATGEVVSYSYDLSGMTFEQIKKMDLRIEFNVLQNDAQRTLNEGDFFVVKLPAAFNISDISKQSVSSGDIVIANYSVVKQEDGTHILTGTFSGAVDNSNYYDIGGRINLEFGLNAGALTDGSENTIPLAPLTENGDKYDVIVNGPSNVVGGVEKTGSYNAGDNTITWTVTVGKNSPDISLKGMTLTDNFDKSQLDFSEAGQAAFAATLNGANITSSINLKNAAVDGKFAYTFGDGAMSPAVLTFTTAVAESAMPGGNNGSSVNIGNDAVLTAPENNDIKVDPDNNGGHGDVPLSAPAVGKDGQQINSNTMRWTINVNQNKAHHLWNVAVTDPLSPGLALKDGTVVVKKGGEAVTATKVDTAPGYTPDSAAHGDFVYTVTETQVEGKTQQTLTFYFPNDKAVQEAYTISFDTTNTDVSMNTDTTINNIATIRWEWPDWTGKGPNGQPFSFESPKVETHYNAAYIKKDVEIEHTKDELASGYLTWSIVPGTRRSGWDTATITDVIGTPIYTEGKMTGREQDQDLVAGSLKLTYKGSEVANQENYLKITKDGEFDVITYKLPSKDGEGEELFADLSQVKITYRTKALNFFKENSTDHTYKNEVNMTVQEGDAHYDAESKAEAILRNDLLAKTAVYEYQNDSDGNVYGALHYTITVNANKLPLTNFTLSDDLTALKTSVILADGTTAAIESKEWTLKDVTVKKDGADTDIFDTEIAGWKSGKKISAELSAVDACYTFELWLTLSDEVRAKYLIKDGTVIHTENTANVKCDQCDPGTEAGFDVTCKSDDTPADVNNKMVDKYTNTPSENKDDRIRWCVAINPNAALLGTEDYSARIEDVIPAGISLQYRSIHLYPTGVDGKYITANDFIGECDISVKAQADGSTLLTVKLPKTARACTLVYDTLLVSPLESGNVKNSATMYLGEDVLGGDSETAEVGEGAGGWLKSKASYSFYKVDSVTEEVTKLSNATFGLYSDPSCDETYLVDRQVSDANGEFTFYGLDPAMTYYLKELEGPGKYQVSDAVTEVFSENHEAGIFTRTLSDDRLAKGSISFTKTFLQNHGTNQAAEFELTLYPLGLSKGMKKTVHLNPISSNTYSYSGVEGDTISPYTSIEVYTGSSGSSTVNITGLPWGEYTLKETRAADGYALNTTETPIYISCDDTGDAPVFTTAYGAKKESSLTIENKPVELFITKATLSTEAMPLVGVKLSIYYGGSDPNPYFGNVMINPVTNEDYSYEITAANYATNPASLTWDITHLPANAIGEYYWLVEDTGPTNGHLAKVNPIRFHVNADGTLTEGGFNNKNELTVHDDPVNITLQKLDQFGANVHGARIVLQKYDGSAWTDVDTLETTSETSSKTFTVQRGEGNTNAVYRFIESSLPEGYLNLNGNSSSVSNNPQSFNNIEFEVDQYGAVKNVKLHNPTGLTDTDKAYGNLNNGSTAPSSYNNQFVMRNIRIVAQAQFTKTDTATPAKALGGVKYDLYRIGTDGADANAVLVNDASHRFTSGTNGLVSTVGSIYHLGLNINSDGRPVDTTYFFREASTHSDFVLDDKTKLYFTLKADGSNSYLWSGNSENSYQVLTPTFDKTGYEMADTVSNEPLNAIVRLNKTKTLGSGQVPAPGAVFELTGTDVNGAQVRTTATSSAVAETRSYTDSNGGTHSYDVAVGEVVFPNVPAGGTNRYEVREISPAYGCKLPDDTFIAYVEIVWNTSSCISIGSTDNNTNDLRIAKRNADGAAGAYAAGAKFRITCTAKPQGSTAPNFTDGRTTPITLNLVDGSYVSVGEGLLVAGNTYQVEEIAPATGTKLPETPSFTFTMGTDGKATVNGTVSWVTVGTDSSDAYSTFLITDEPNELLLKKVDLANPGTLVGGATFTLTGLFANAAGVVESTESTLTLISSADGTLSFADAVNTENPGYIYPVEYDIQPYRTYVLKETVPAPGYRITPFTESYPDAVLWYGGLTISVDKSGSFSYRSRAGSDYVYVPLEDNTLIIKDQKNEVKLVKKNADGSKTIANGYTFTIKPVEGAEFATEVAGSSTASRILTGDTVKSFAGQLISGKNYTVSETVPPDGYKSVTDFTVTVDNSGKLSFVGTAPTGVSLSFDDNNGTAIITVCDSETGLSLTKYDSADKDSEEPAALSGAVYTLSGVFTDSAAGASSDKTITSAESAASLSGVMIAGNTYTIKETVPAPGHVISPITDSYPDAKLSGGSMSIRLKTDGSWEYLKSNDSFAALAMPLKFFDEKNSVQLNKFDLNDGPLTGYSFTIEPDTDTNPDYKFAVKDANDSDTAARVLASDNVTSFKGQLIAGQSYIVKETVSPNGYQSVPDFSISVDESGAVTIAGDQREDVSVDTDTGAIVVKDTPTKALITKTDESGNLLPGAVFTLSGKFAGRDETALSFTTTDAAPTSLAEGLFQGLLIVDEEYTLTETTPPEGYRLTSFSETYPNAELTDGKMTLTVDAEGKLYYNIDGGKTALTNNTVAIEDQQNSVKIVKQNSDGSKTFDKGYYFMISPAEGDSFATEVKGSKTAARVLASDDVSEFKAQLVAGDSYVITESIAPAGYKSAKDITVKVAANGSLSLSTERDDVSLGFNAETGLNTITVKDSENEFSLIKYDIEDKDSDSAVPLEGAVYTLTGTFADAADKTTSKTITSADDVAKLTGLMAAGYTFYLKETVPADGYVISPLTDSYPDAHLESDGAMTIILGMDGSLLYLMEGDEASFEELELPLVLYDAKNSVKLTKKNANGSEDLTGYEFSIKPDDGSSFATEGDDTRILASDSVTSFEGQLIAGQKYIVSETASPDGFRAVPNFSISIDEKGTVSILGEARDDVRVDPASGEIIVRDPPTKASFTKTDESGNLLSGAVFTLSGKFAGRDETELSFTTTDAAPTALAEGLFEGLLIVDEEYTLTETTPPEGYRISFTPAKFRVLLDGSMQVKLSGDTDWSNVSDNLYAVPDAENSFSLKKTDSEGNALEGAKFSIKGTFAGETGETTRELLAAGSEVTADKILIADNVYTISETQTPVGYVTIPDFTVTMHKDGTVSLGENSPAGVSVSGSAVTVKNSKTAFTLRKADENGTALSGASFSIQGKFTDESTEKTLLSGSETESLTGLLIGGESYTLSETKAPDGCIGLTEPFTVKMNTDGTLSLNDGTSEFISLNEDKTAVTVRNAPIAVTLRKTSREDGENLQNCSFEITGKFVDGSLSLKGIDDVLTELMRGNLLASDVENGQPVPGGEWNVYSIRETNPPAGYQIEERSVEFVVDRLGQTYLLSGDGTNEIAESDGATLSFSDPAIRTTIAKLDENAKPLAGAELKLTGKFADGTTEKSFTSTRDPYVLEALLTAGESYTLTETKAPTGYKVMGGSVKFTVDMLGVITVTADPEGLTSLTGDKLGLNLSNKKEEPKPSTTPTSTPKPVETPQTGDSTNLPLFALLFIASALSALSLLFLRRRRS